jgi:hypothetical protein
MNKGGNVAYHDVADLNHPKLDKGGARHAVRRCHLDAVIAWRGMDAEPRSIASAQRDLRRAGVDNQLAAIAGAAWRAQWAVRPADCQANDGAGSGLSSAP